MISKLEHVKEPLASRKRFVKRLGHHLVFTSGIVAIALIIGIVGYHWLAGFSWIDSLLNASMLLGGMGPVGEIPTDGGKIFASVYALFAGLVLIASAGIILTPVLHRVMHRLHVEGR